MNTQKNVICHRMSTSMHWKQVPTLVGTRLLLLRFKSLDACPLRRCLDIQRLYQTEGPTGKCVQLLQNDRFKLRTRTLGWRRGGDEPRIASMCCARRRTGFNQGLPRREYLLRPCFRLLQALCSYFAQISEQRVDILHLTSLGFRRGVVRSFCPI